MRPQRGSSEVRWKEGCREDGGMVDGGMVDGGMVDGGMEGCPDECKDGGMMEG